jgi:hypothetical protein
MPIHGPQNEGLLLPGFADNAMAARQTKYTILKTFK